MDEIKKAGDDRSLSIQFEIREHRPFRRLVEQVERERDRRK